MYSRIGRRERWFFLIISIIITMATWAVGCMWLTTQWVLLGFSALGLLISLLPMPPVYFESNPDTGWDNAKRLVKFPLFWFGIAVLGYICVQALNAQLEIVFENSRFESYPRAHLEGWPSSIMGPIGTTFLPNGTTFYGMNAWRILIICGTSFFIAMGMWLNIKHRRTLRAIGWVLMLNASCMALYGVWVFLQTPPSHTILGWVHVENGRPFGSFDYPNHGAAFMNLALGCTLALALEGIKKGRTLNRSSPLPFFMLCAFMLSTGIIVSASRVGIILMALLWGAFLILNACTQRLTSRKLIAAGAIGLFFALGGYGIVQALEMHKSVLGVIYHTQESQWDFIEKKFDMLFSHPFKGSDSSRPQMWKATLDMWHAEPIWGWGAGSYRYISPAFFLKNDVFVSKKDPSRLTIRAEYAHSDPLQWMAECGIAGCMLLAAVIGCVVWGWCCGSKQLGVLGAMLIITVILFSLHSCVDFMFYCPSNLATVTVLAMAAWKWSQIKRPMHNGISSE